MAKAISWGKSNNRLRGSTSVFLAAPLETPQVWHSKWRFSGHNGEVKIVRPADPVKLAAYREARAQQKQKRRKT